MIDVRGLTAAQYRTCVPVIEPWVDVDTLVLDGFGAWDAATGGLVACAGILPYWPGVGEAWFALGPDAEPRHHREGISLVKAHLASAFAHGGYRRIQADVRDEHQRWARLLRFELESEMRAYGPDGSTYFRYVRFT